MTKFTGIFVLSFVLLFEITTAQNVGINTTGSAPNSSAMLDVSASNKGILIPRVALTGTNDVSTILSPALSLLIYNTSTVSDVSPGFYFWNGTKWATISSAINGNGATNHVSYWSDASTISFDLNQFYWDPINNRLGIGNSTPNQSLDITGNIRMSGNRSKLFFQGDNSTTLAGGLGLHATNSGIDVFMLPLNPSTGAYLNTANFFLGSAGAYTTQTANLFINGQIGVNTTTIGAYQSKINAADGNSGLYVDKDQNLSGATFYGIYTHASNFDALATKTTGIQAVAETNNGETYGVRGITEHSGSGDMYSVAGESWDFNQTTLNTAGYLGYYEGFGGTKGYKGYIGVLGIVENNNGFVSESSYAGYFSNTMDQSTTSGDLFGVYSVVNAQAFTDDDNSYSWGLFASATNSENIIGIEGVAQLNNWNQNDLLTGVTGKIKWVNNVYAQGYLGYNDSDNDITGINALVGVAGVITDDYTNNNKITAAGFFNNYYDGTSGNRSVDAYGIYAISDGIGTTGSVNYGIYATASNATTNYAAVLDGDVIIGTNGTTVSNIIKTTVSKDITDPASAGIFEETFTVTNANIASTVYVSPEGGIETNILIVGAWVSAANTVTVRFYAAAPVTTASRNWHITVIE
ncbi:MAG: hypothetical protein JXR68_00990 [Bacteroidales bacterium]|nr:hypothetical protein [Bacteroidales bacterium]